MDYVLLGERIRKERLNRELTQESLAEFSNISASFLGLVERGQRKLSVETLVNISKALDVSTDYLLQGNNTCKNDGLDKLNFILSKKSEEEIELISDVAKTIFKHRNESQ